LNIPGFSNASLKSNDLLSRVQDVDCPQRDVPSAILLGIGCHQDLKPGNILVDGDTFLLADFGLSRFKESIEGSYTSYKSVGGYYVAPECEDF
jgi:serine/threonine protein kinase